MSKKTLYHSELSKLGIINARVNSEPLKSQYPDKPKYVVLEIDSEERFYNCENDECELALTGLKDTWVELEAFGSREEAEIRIDRIEKPANAREAIKQAKAKIAAMPDDRPPDEKPRPKAVQSDLQDADPHGQHGEIDGPPVDANGEGSKLKSYAAHSAKIFALAWEESKGIMALIPKADGEGMSTFEWTDLRLRIAQNIAIEVNKIIRKERF